MAKTVNLKLTTAYDSKGVRAALSDVKALQTALAGVGKGSASRSNPFDSFVKGARAAETEIDRLVKAQREAAKPPKSSGGDPFAPLQKSAQKAERDLLQLASAQARLASAKGDAAGAVKALSSALDQVDKNSIQAVRAMTQLERAQNALNGSAREASGGVAVLPRTFAGLSGPAATAAKAITVVGVAIAGLRKAADLLGGAVHQVGDFQENLSLLKANAGATADQMGAVQAKAIALGADLTLPATSAASATGAMLELVKAGLSLNEAMDASRGTLQLAAAGGIAESEAATIAAAALNTFGLAGTDAVMVADQLAAGAAATATDVHSMGESIEMGGALFSSYQTRVLGGKEALTQFNTAVGVLATNGVVAGKAGTYIASAMERLANPTERAKGVIEELSQKLGISGDIAYTASGQMRPFEEIMRNVAAATADMSDKQRDAAISTIFMTEGSKAVIPIVKSMSAALKDSGISWDEIKAKTTEAGAAQAQAAARMEGINGAVRNLQSQLETLALNGILPLAPIIQGFIGDVASMAAALQGPAAAGATALATAMNALGAFIQSNAIPALQALTAAGAAYALTQVPAMITASRLLIKTLSEQVGAWATTNAAMLGTVGLFAVVGVAAFVAAKEYQRFTESISSGTDALLNSRSWWTDAADAIKQYNDMLAQGAPAQDAMSAKMQSAANTVQILKDQIKGEIEELAKRKAILEAFKSVGIVDPAAEQAVSDQLAHINQLSDGLQNATTYLDSLTGAQQEANAAGITASAVYNAQRGDLANLGNTIKLLPEEIDEITKAIGKTTDEGIKALGEYVNQNVEFTSKIAQSQEEHASKMAALAADRGKAETDAARAAVDEKIAAEQAGYSKELAAQAAAYAQQEAAQKAHLGQMLIDYTVEQAKLGNISSDRAAALVEGIKTEYGVIKDVTSAAFLQSTGIIDQFGKNTAESVGQATSQMHTATDASVTLAQRMADLQQERTIKITADFEKDQDIEKFKARLAALPAEVQTEVLLEDAAAQTSMSDYVRSTKAIPGSVSTTVVAETQAAHDAISDFSRGVDAIPAAHITHVTAETASAATSMSDYVRSTKGVPTELKTQVEVESAAAQGNIAAVKGALDSIPRNVTSTITVQRVEQITSSGIKRASGGFVHGPGSGTSDSIPARLSNGEFVVRASQAQKHAPLLHAINSGVQGFADGGMAGGTPLQSSRGSLELQAPTVSVTAGTTPAAAITAQKAVNDKMLSDLHDYLDDALKAAEDYQKKRLDIEKQFQDDLASQIQENNVSKYESRADFYDSLTSATKDIGQEQAQALAASYEEWYGKARQAEQNGQADLAQQYESYANKRLGSELEYQKKVADIKKDGVTGDEQAELQRMSAIKQIRDQGMDAELTNIEQGGDKLVKARDAALSDADKAYQDRQKELESKAAESFGEHADAATGASSTVVTAIDAETSAVGRLRDALNNLPIEKTVSVNVNQTTSTATTTADSGGDGGAGGGTTTSSGGGAGGNTFIGNTNRVSKLGGVAASSSSGSSDPLEIIRQAQAILDVLARGANRKQIYQLKDYRLQLDEAAQILANAANMAQTFSRPVAPIDVNAVRQLAADMRAVDDIFLNSILKNVKSWNYLAGQYKEVSASAISVLKDVASFRNDLKAENLAPLDLNLIMELASQANQITRAITGVLIPNYSWQLNQLDLYHETLTKEVDILKSVADLRRDLDAPVPPFDVDQILALAQQTRDIGKAIGDVLVPVAQRDLDDVTNYADAVNKSTGILSDTAQLARDLKDPTPPISVEQITALAKETLDVGAAIGGVMVPVAEASQKTLDQYGAAVRGSVDILKSVSDLRKTLTDKDAQGPLDIALVVQLAADARQALYYVQGNLLVYTQQAQDELTAYAAMAKNAIDTLNGVAQLRKSVADSGGALDPALLQRMAQDAQQAAYYVLGAMITATQETADGLERYAGMAASAVGVLKDVADLRKSLTDLAGPIDAGAVQRLATEAQQVVRMLLGQLLPTTQEQADALERYQSAVGSSASILKDTADLGRGLATVGPAISAASVQRLASEAQRVTGILEAAVVPTSQEQVDALSRWQDAVGASASIIKDTLGVTASMWTDYQSPTDAQLSLIARDADRVVRTMAQAATTYSTDGLANAKAYADAVGSTFGAFKDGLLFFDALKSGDFGLDQGALARFEADATQAMAVAGRLEAMAQSSGSTALVNVMSGLNTTAQTLMTLADLPRVDWGQMPSGGGRSISIGAINVYPPEGADAYQTAQYTIAMLNQEVAAHV